MPLESQFSHRAAKRTNLPYIPLASPVDTTPHYVVGSQDIMTSISGFAERRPGFADTVEVTPTTFVNLQRLFTWNRFDGTFIEMACDVSGGSSIVYKRVVGTDNSFVSIYTDAGSSTPFDFVTARNTVYFSNGNTSRKWDPTNGLSNWGITAPAAAPVLSTDGRNAGTGAGTNWTTPGNATGAPDQAYAVFNTTTQDFLRVTNYSLVIPAGAQITGFAAKVTGHATNTTAAERQVGVSLTLDGSTIAGTEKTLQTLNLVTDSTLTLGGVGDLWGNTSISIAQATAATFGVLIRKSTATANEIDIDAVNLTVFWTISGSGAAVGGISSTVGWTYKTCYGNSNSGHISSPSSASNSTGIVTNTSVGISLTASTDAQVNQIRVFRSTDGGGGNWFEIANSPFANTTATVYDTTTDINLNIFSLAPTPNFNDPPPAWQGMVYFAGRIWGFVNDRVWFTGLEEINNGVGEESVPSGVAGNFWRFDQPVTGLAAVGDINQALVIFCAGRIYLISGNTLDTFRRVLITNRRGCRTRTAIVTLGGMVAWFDTSSQIWASDGRSFQEIGQDLRPDLTGLSGTGVSLAFHTAGKAHWLVMGTSSNTTLVYDMDMEQWMPPWKVTASYVYSGEVSAGNYKLMIALGSPSTKAMMLNTSLHNDNGASYTPVAQTNLIPLTPDFGNSIYALIYDAPSRTGQPWYVQVDTNNVALGDVLFLMDDDPTVASPAPAYASIFAQKTDTTTAFNRANGTTLVQNVYAMIRPTGRWFSLQIKGATADDALKIYSFFVAYKEFR